MAAVPATLPFSPKAVGEWQKEPEFDGSSWIVVKKIARVFKVKSFEVLDLSLVHSGDQFIFESERLARVDIHFVEEAFKFG